MALAAPSSTLTGQTIADSYDQVLFLDSAAGVTEATLKIVSGTAGKTALSISDEHVLVKGVDTNNAAGFEVQQTDGTSILKVAAGTPSVLVSGSGVKLYFSDAGGEYISGDGTDLTIAAGTALNITADVIDLSDATKDVTLNAAVDALNFDSNTLSIDASNNRIGIGTAAPDGTVHCMKGSAGSINSDANTVLTIENSDTAVLQILCPEANNGYILMGNPNDGNADGRLRYNNSTREMSLWTAATERLTIDSAGNVGIGVTDPDCTLEVSGTDAMSVPSGTTGQRPTARNGMIRYNSTEDEMEAYIDGNWSNFDITVPPYNASWLVLAGGGGGATSGAGVGGGGAGGYRSSYNSEGSGGGGSAESALSLNIGTQYTITVGAGGAGASSSGAGSQGSASSLTGSDITDITTVGGGAGTGQSGGGTVGGSGGGGAYTGGGQAGTSGQGYAGGSAVYFGGNKYAGGAGGGAGGVGLACSNPNSGQGGPGVASTITGSSVYRGGGGGGGGYVYGGAGPASATGGGTAGVRGHSLGGTDINAADAAANTGAGGGGGDGGTSTGGDGGSGVVIIRVPTANYSGTTTGSPTVTTDGSDTIMVFNASGTYTA